jgi:glutamate synthase (NADPH/NADH) large chain
LLDEHDACAIVASIRKGGEATHGNLKRTIEALGKMGHRSGDVQGEGDGCGVLTDIPRRVWARNLESMGRPAWLSEDKRFFVGHLMIPRSQEAGARQWKDRVVGLAQTIGADVLLEQPGVTRPEALGRMAQAQEPVFWQMAGMLSHCALCEVERTLFDLTLKIERETPLHVASLSSHTVVHKVRGAVETLYHYYPELRSREFTSAITIGHARYSTNTATAFERVQPFSLLGHNGEINTIARLREQILMLGGQLVASGSDSQDLNRALEMLVHHCGFTLLEAMEIVFPPIVSAMAQMPPDQRTLYEYYRQALGPFAQGPAAIVARFGDECAFSVDALGLRPLWFGETEKEYFFSSEKGVVPLDLLNSSPKPFGPGEKMGLHLRRDGEVTVLDHRDIRRYLLDRGMERFGPLESLRTSYAYARFPSRAEPVHELAELSPQFAATVPIMEAFGWSQGDVRWARALADTGRDPIGSLGYDSPLAALDDAIHNLSDYFKETIAVVTNPAIDREREQEHFSTRVIVGPKPPLSRVPGSGSRRVILPSPILVEPHEAQRTTSDSGPKLSQAPGSERAVSLPRLVSFFQGDEVARLSLTTDHDETIRDCVDRLARDAVRLVRSGVHVVLLDDGLTFRDGHGWVDPHLAVAAIDAALRIESGEDACGEPGPESAGCHQVSLRRSASIIVRSGSVRNLHDIILLVAVGADAVSPYLLLETAVGASASAELADRRRADALHALRVGLEKITSTMGIHELRGYGRIFSSIGLSTSLAAVMAMPNYAGSAVRGLMWKDLDRDAERRRSVAVVGRSGLPRRMRFYERAGKPLRRLVGGDIGGAEAFDRIRELELEEPVAMRHTLAYRFANPASGPPSASRELLAEDVDAEITGHSLPFVFASMSFGSQSEVAYRAYAEAAHRLNIIALNGEGGEIEDLLGKYPHNRGQQIASGRFGVHVDYINASNLLEIKIGQGAKPGEGGHLPGRKVSRAIARARNVSPGIDLISPSNNHDIYSIEDLAQFIEELKTCNPKARVAVKVPVVPGIGVIAVGIAKAGADMINLTGFDGGTGAARAHSIRHVGLPAEIGLVEAHRALLQSSMRRRVELWADGGIRSPDDVVKLMCLGANRVGFGTLAMVALGCRLCRRCHLGACPRGITSHPELVRDGDDGAEARPGLLDFQQGVDGLTALFGEMGREVRAIAARLGIGRLQDLVGRSDLLVQDKHTERLDMDSLLAPASRTARARSRAAGLIPLRRPRNHLTTVVSNLVMEAVDAGERIVVFEDDRVTPVDRALGTHLAGALTRYRRRWTWSPGHNGVGGQLESWRSPSGGSRSRGAASVGEARLRFYASSVPGNGLGAFSCDPIRVTVEGGAQDGVAKGLRRGRVIVLKGYNHDGVRIDGSVGKGLAYGATGGLVVVQGNADSRACIRLSGADVIIGGEIAGALHDDWGDLAARANVKGFLCEYMTAGRVLVLGDPGPWICAGMTDGVLYLRLQPELGFEEQAIKRRIAQGASVRLCPVAAEDGGSLRELLLAYTDELARNQQPEEARRALGLLDDWQHMFVKIVPQGLDGHDQSGPPGPT